MNILPDNFPVATVPSTEVHKLQWFYGRFVEDYNEEYGYGHFILAAYASIPLYLTPDLLYKTWQNFNKYVFAGTQMSIHRIAVADILLSPLCREIGVDLYEMHAEIKLAFLEWLNQEVKTERGKKRRLHSITEIAQFVKAYFQSPPAVGTNWGSSYIAAQELESQAYIDPAAAIQSIFKKFPQAANDTDLMRVMDTLINTKKRLEKIDQKSAVDLAMMRNQSDLMNIWISLIQKNEAHFIRQLNQQPELLNLLKETSSGGIRIDIEGGIVQKLNVIASRKTRALLAGFTGQDHNNVHAIEAMLEKTLPSEDLELELMLPSKTELSANDVLGGLELTVNACSKEDNLFVYISGAAYRQQDHCVFEKGVYDEDVAAILNRSSCASVNLIVEADHSGSHHWMDVSIPGRSVLTSCMLHQRSIENDHRGESNISTFTQAVIETILPADSRSGNSNTPANIRLLFLNILSRFKDQPHRYTDEFELWQHAAPQLFASPVTLEYILLGQGTNRSRLQALLRQANFFHLQSTGLWDKATREAFEAYRLTTENQRLRTYDEHFDALNHLISETAARQKHIFLLVFSDPEKTLSELDREKTMIMHHLQAKYPAFDLETITLDNPNKKIIQDIFTRSENRNRIRYFYYSGTDKQGNFNLPGGEMTFIEFGRLLDFQPQIELFISNTCKSAVFAGYMSQMGAKYAIGCGDFVYDNYAAQFATELFEALHRGENIEDLDKLQSPPEGEDYGYSAKR